MIRLPQLMHFPLNFSSLRKTPVLQNHNSLPSTTTAPSQQASSTLVTYPPTSLSFSSRLFSRRSSVAPTLSSNVSLTSTHFALNRNQKFVSFHVDPPVTVVFILGTIFAFFVDINHFNKIFIL